VWMFLAVATPQVKSPLIMSRICLFGKQSLATGSSQSLLDQEKPVAHPRSTQTQHSFQFYLLILYLNAQGFIAPTKVKPAGKVSVPWARLMVTTLSSMGCRITSRTRAPE